LSYSNRRSPVNFIAEAIVLLIELRSYQARKLNQVLLDPKYLSSLWDMLGIHVPLGHSRA